MNRRILSLCLALLFLMSWPCARAENGDDRLLRTLRLNDVDYVLGMSTCDDLVRAGWSMTVETDGRFAFTQGDACVYASTVTGHPKTALVMLDAPLGHGVCTEYCGFVYGPGMPDEERLQDLWRWMAEEYEGQTDRNGAVCARVVFLNGRCMELTTDRERICMKLDMDREASGAWKSVHSAAQGLSLRCPEDWTETETDKGGLLLTPAEGENGKSMRVQVIRGTTDATEYLHSLLGVELRAEYGQLTDADTAFACGFGGRPMLGAEYHAQKDMEETVVFCLLEQCSDCVIRYDAVFGPPEREAMLRMLNTLTGSVTMDDGQATAEAGWIECTEQGFRLRCDPASTWASVPGHGVTVYPDVFQGDPTVSAQRMPEHIWEGKDYIRQQFTPAVREHLGDSLLSAEEPEDYAIGGRTLPAGVYRYSARGRVRILIRVLDVTEQDTVMYTAEFAEEDGIAAIAALDLAVRSLERLAE